MQLGLVEGFFGTPWGWQARHDALSFLRDEGFSLYIYAPKADRHLRSAWREPHPPEEQEALHRFVEAARDAGIEVVPGLSPLGLHEDERDVLLGRVEQLLRIGVTGLGLFFDDMRGDDPRLAQVQGALCTAVAEAHPGLRLWFCPTYYSDDPVLDKVFGPRPARYLETLRETLPSSIEVFWTGPKVCSTAYEAADLSAVRERIGRPLAIWDNYPVNDGPRMCKHLHLRPPKGRSPVLRDAVSTWCLNPMNQPVLSRLPLAATARLLRGEPFQFAKLAAALYGEPVAEALLHWVDRFQDEGLARWGGAPEPLALFRALPGEAAAEVVHWLEGRSVVGPECLTDV